MKTNENADNKSARRRTIIAVGGAKGGIGKSIFTANLGIFLSSTGKRTVLVDLDLGGANLHLYMGVWGLKLRIDDYLSKRVETLEAVMQSTKYGPALIGGGGGLLGSANIHFARKLKLMNAIKKLDADYIILDLGGDTTYNILDFFLIADKGIILTTCDPASYLDAYGFIKMALFRRLKRLFGPESDLRKFRDKNLEAIINNYLITGKTKEGSRIDDLMKDIETECPEHLHIIKQALNQFRPNAVVSMFENREEVENLLTRLKTVSSKMLSIDVAFAGGIPFENEIRQSARELVPNISTNPDGVLKKALIHIASNMDLL